MPLRCAHHIRPPTRPHPLRRRSCPPGQRLCRIYTKGASEIVLERCSHVLGPEGSRQRLAPAEREALLREFSQGGQR